MLQFIVGLLLGTTLGVVIMSIMAIAAESDRLDEYFKALDKIDGHKNDLFK